MRVTSPNLEAESRCLSALMRSAYDAFAAASAGLNAEHFSDTSHRRIYAAINAAAAETGSTDLEAVWRQLTSLDGNSPVPMARLLEVDGLEPTSINRANWVEAVIASARKRSLTAALKAAEIAANNDATSWGELWSSVAPHIEAAQATAADIAPRSLKDMCANVRRDIEHPEVQKLLSTQIGGWDRAAGPLRAGEMVTIAARPGCGKTAIGMQIAHSVAASGATVAFFSLEMSGEELVGRIARMRAGSSMFARQNALIEQVDAIAKLKTLFVYDNADAHTLATIEARCRLLSTMPGGLALVVVDYLQLVEPSDHRAPREQQVALMSRRLKRLAGALKCPVIVLAQLNRESEKEERRPRLSDLRESGAIEQDSDRVWFLWQDPKHAPQTTEEPSEIDVTLIQAKCRGGRPNVAMILRFNRPCYTFTPAMAKAA